MNKSNLIGDAGRRLQEPVLPYGFQPERYWGEVDLLKLVLKSFSKTDYLKKAGVKRGESALSNKIEFQDRNQSRKVSI